MIWILLRVLFQDINVIRKMDNLKDYLLDLALALNIDVVFTKQRQDFVPRAVPDERLVIINSNWKRTREIPFQIGHEMGHLVHNDTIIDCESPNAHLPNELSADKYSLNLIFKYNLVQVDTITSPSVFLFQYGIPFRMTEYTNKVFKENKNLLF